MEGLDQPAVPLQASRWKNDSANHNEMQSNFDKRELKTTREAPAYRIFPLYFALSACETSHNAQKKILSWAFYRLGLPLSSKFDSS
jgi:hypothetical protein